MNEIVERIKSKRPNPEKDRIWRLENKEKLNKQSLEWNHTNKERLKEYRLQNKEKFNEVSRVWQKENRDRANATHINYVRRRITKDPFFKFSNVTRLLIVKSFRRGSKSLRKNNKTEEILGCTINYFIEYILSKCPEGITINDFTQFGYHLDHIIPIASANTEEEVIKLNHYTNFQPLWWRDNIIKSNKIVWE